MKHRATQVIEQIEKLLKDNNFALDHVDGALTIIDIKTGVHWDLWDSIGTTDVPLPRTSDTQLLVIQKNLLYTRRYQQK